MNIDLLDYPLDPAVILQKKRALKNELLQKEGLVPKKVAILSGVTVGVFQDLLEVFLLANGIRPTVFYCNPNIYPQAEYEIRKEEAIRFVTSKNLDFIDADYDYAHWLHTIKGLENEPERGSRCLKCFTLRLTETARYASEHGFSVFTTTLASSRWKSLEQINEAGRRAAALYPGTLFWEQNWRKGGLQDRRNQLLKEYDFYNQQYCGCQFSMQRLDAKQESITDK